MVFGMACQMIGIACRKGRVRKRAFARGHWILNEEYILGISKFENGTTGSGIWNTDCRHQATAGGLFLRVFAIAH